MIELYQSPVRFDEAEHRYWLGERELPGVTSTLIERAFPHPYDDIPEEKREEILNRAAARGTAIHKSIEDYEENSTFDDIPELENYVTIKEEQKLTHVISEYLVSDEQNYASKIDHVFIDENGEIVIADVKTTYKPYYDHVTLQLSIYKRFFEMQNPNLKVSKCVLIWLRNDKYEYKELPVWGDELLDDLICADLQKQEFDIVKTYGDLPEKVAAVENYLVALDLEVKAKTEELNAIKEGLCQCMMGNVKTGVVKKYSTPRLTMTLVEPKPRKTFDSKRFQQEHPELYKEYLVLSDVKPSVRLTINKNETKHS